MWFPTIPTGSSCGVVCVRSREDEFRREWPPQLICLHSDCCLSCLNEQSGGFAINELWDHGRDAAVCGKSPRDFTGN
jgi:hypothetical protein